MKTTKEILNKFHITRQSISNWEKYGNLKTKRSASNRFIWDEESITWLEKFIKSKGSNKKNNDVENNYFSIQNRRYLGSKSRLLEFINNVVQKETKNVKTIADIFAGTGVVSEMFFNQGKNIIVNDILDSNFVIYKTFFGSEKVDRKKIHKIIDEMNSITGNKNYVSKNYGNRYFSMENAKKIGSVRQYIDNLSNINDREKAILLTSLLYAMDKVANTVGHYDAYRRVMDSLQPIYFRVPKYPVNFKNSALLYHEDANNLVRKIKPDLVYIDTPYNSRQYGDAYHLLENIVDWKKPELYGVAMKAKDRSKTKSSYSTAKAPEVFSDLIQNIDSRYILVSYNNMAKKGSGRSNAKISNEEIIDILSKRGPVKVFSEDFQVFSTGKTNIKGHKELLYFVEVK
ncbi:DNA adenine methylase [Apilactobacillus xinyiensis]|uniref:DNA adenine methylase n=1 Tax=Apilactobacillus xinyiensis TaxID=2841032 RepID=UPI00200E1201|nr:DNA adenine methylase [Apilactobacillus xinyiensis]MCL0330794.1 DNA adenine methylase [Apilactobacillus xinyiensis]